MGETLYNIFTVSRLNSPLLLPAALNVVNFYDCDIIFFHSFPVVTSFTSKCRSGITIVLVACEVMVTVVEKTCDRDFVLLFW